MTSHLQRICHRPFGLRGTCGLIACSGCLWSRCKFRLSVWVFFEFLRGEKFLTNLSNRLFQIFRLSNNSHHTDKFIAETAIVLIEINIGLAKSRIVQERGALNETNGFVLKLFYASAIAGLKKKRAKFFDVLWRQRGQSFHGLPNVRIVIEEGLPNLIVRTTGGGGR